MSTQIDPMANVHPDAQIGEGTFIGPFCVVGPHVKLGKNCMLQSNVVVDGCTTVGDNARIFPFASVGTQSQDLKWKPENKCYTEIGDNVIIRENVTIHAGTDDGTYTKIGNDCALLALSHVGHNCEVGNNVVLSHNATLGGHVIVGDHANVGGLSAVHQFVHIGQGAMVAGMARVIQDILPFTIAEGAPAASRIVNKIGMERTGYSKEEVTAARTAYKTIFLKKLPLEEAIEVLKNDFTDNRVIDLILDFLAKAERGLARPS